MSDEREATSLTLYEAEAGLAAAVMDAEDRPSDDDALVLVGEWIKGAVAKRDRVAKFRAHLIDQQDFAKAEIERLRARQASFTKAQERLDGYIINVMEGLGVKKLEGQTATFSLRKRPDVVHVEDDVLLTDKYVDITLSKMSRADYSRILASLDEAGHGDMVSTLAAGAKASPRKRELLAALKAGQDIPGADIRYGANSLVVK